eukprot:gene18023-24435_t
MTVEGSVAVSKPEASRSTVSFELPKNRPASLPPIPSYVPAVQSSSEETSLGSRPEWKTTAVILMCCSVGWVICSTLDFFFTPRVESGPHLFSHTTWCMVAYFCNLLFTLPKLCFETNGSKLMLHVLISYISILASGSYVMLWTGFSPIQVDVNSCLYIPQRWLLYCYTAPAIITILAKISNYSNRQLIWVIFIFEIMLIAGGIGTIPWISWNEKVFFYIITNLPFPEILLHMWRMVTSAINEADPSSVRFLLFMAVFTEVTWIIFPIVYYASIAGMPLYLSEPLWSLTDWLTKFVFASSLMEANFFTLAQRRAETMKRVEDGHRSATILQLTKAIERKDDFLSTMSHELRTPLNGIIGLSESLMEGAVGGPMNTRAHQTIKVVVLSAKRLLQLINDVLDAAKLKQGTMIIKHEKVNVRSIVTDVLDLCSPLIKKGVRLVNMVGANIPRIVGDNGRIAQMLYNLIGNAAKFTEHGTVSVTAGMSEGGDCIYISVTDTGEGIPAEKLENIFVAFEQVDMSTTRRHGGTGLGLHLVKELVKSHNGEITVQSVLKKGSTFTVWLPITQSGDPYQTQDADRLHLAGESDDDDFPLTSIVGDLGDLMGQIEVNSGGKKEDMILVSSTEGFKAMKPFYREVHGGCMVLSVDDDPINQMVVDNLLAPEGYVIHQAMNGTAALKFLEDCETLPDVILLDVMMPDISGYEVCMEIRRRHSTVHIPIIMVSAKGNPEHVMKGLEAGSVDYVKKPFHRKELLSRVRAQIRNREVFEVEMASRKVNDTLRRMMPMVEHTGDSYMAVSGHDGAQDHTKRLVSLAQDMLNLTQKMKFSNGDRVCIKIGIHCGPAYAGVVGLESPRYCVFGDTVNITSRLENSTYAQTVQVSSQVAAKDRSLFVPYKAALDVGSHTIPTFLLACGDYAAALTDLKTHGSSNGAVRAKTESDSAALSAVEVEAACAAAEENKTLHAKLEALSSVLETHVSRNMEAEKTIMGMREAVTAAEDVKFAYSSTTAEVQKLQSLVVEAQAQAEAAEARATLAAQSESKAYEMRAQDAHDLEAQLADLNTRLHAAQMAEAQAIEDAQELLSLQKDKDRQEKAIASPGEHILEGYGNPGLSHSRGTRHAAGPSRSNTWKNNMDGPSQGSFSNLNGGGSQCMSEGFGDTKSVCVQGSFGNLNGGGSQHMSEGFSDTMSVRSAVANQMVDDFLHSDYSIEALLQDLGLPQYMTIMRAQNLTPILLSGMSSQDLMELGVDTVGARQRILETARQYRLKMESSTRMLLIYKDSGVHR